MCGLRDDDLARGLDAVQLRHLDVHHDDVGLQLLRQRDRLRAVDGLTHDLDQVIRSEQGAQAAPEDRVVVGDQRADGIHEASSCRGRRACTTVPPPSALAMLQVPPSSLGALAHRAHADAGPERRAGLPRRPAPRA